MKQAPPVSAPAIGAQPSYAQTVSSYSPTSRAALTNNDGMTDRQALWLSIIRVSAWVFFVLSVLGGIGMASEIGDTLGIFSRNTGGAQFGAFLTCVIGGFFIAVFLNMAGDLLELKCCMKSRRNG
jgi:hypothetical protein